MGVKVKARLTGVVCVFCLALFAGNSANGQDFKGFYIGGSVGGVHGNSDAQTSTVFSSSGYFATTSVPAIATVGAQSPSANGFAGGGQAGYNFQSRRILFGVEADFGGMNISESATGTATYPCCAPTAFTITQTVKTSWLFTLRPRVGVAVRRLLVYGTGGMAMTDANYQALFTDTFATAHENGGKDSTLVGWTAGAGAEVKVSRRLSVKGEYLYADFGSETNTSTNLTAFTPPIAFPTNVFTHTADLRAHIYRFGFNVHF